MYSHFLKRVFDFLFSFMMIIILSPVIFVLMVLGAIFLKGNPFFVQLRPGKKGKDGKERMFNLIKFRTMSNKKDENGDLLPDNQRLGGYGKFLRSTSLDELPELFNIFVGQLAFIGPRPQLIRDVVFMNEEQRHRHDVRPGLSGLAQVSGRNNIIWERKLELDLEYVKKITFWRDVKIFFMTIGKVLKRSDVVREGTVSDMDFGDWLLMNDDITEKEYKEKQLEAKEILKNGKI